MADVPKNRANRAQHAEQRAEAYRLKLRGLSDRAVGERLGVSHTTVQNWTRQEADERVLPLAEELRKVQLERLGEMRQAALQVLETVHVTVQQGRIVADSFGDPVPDDAPVLAAIDRLLRIEERIAKLCGLDAPLEVDATVEQRTPEVAALIERARAEQSAREAELTGEAGA